MRGWGRRRDASLRQELQRCQCRIRLAQAALAAFRERFIPMAMGLPIIDVTELLSYLERAENLLASAEGGGR
jgi:hypothetical protein